MTSATFQNWHITHSVNCGESACMFYFDGENLQQQNSHGQRLTQALLSHKPDWITEIVPSFDSVMVCFNPLHKDHYQVFEFLSSLPVSAINDIQSVHHQINVIYDRFNQMDLATVARALECSVNDVIKYHSEKRYTAYAVGFSPGFAYLGQTNPLIHVPRIKKPRTKVPKGAVALADSYTAVYPDESPGGWNLIGMLAEHQPSMLERNIKVGDTVQFVDSNDR